MSEHDFNYRGLIPGRMTLGVAASTLIDRGNIVGQDTNGDAVEGGTIAAGCLAGAGRSLYKADNSAGLARAINVEVELGVFEWINSSGDPVTAADVGNVVYIEGEATIAKTSSSGTLAVAGIMTELTAEGLVAVFMAPYVTDLERAAAGVDAGISMQKRTVTVLHSDLINDVDNTPTAVNIGAVLPANARILGVDFRVYTPFTGGGLSAVTVDVGTSGDIDALIDGADVFAAAVDGGPATIPQGIRPHKTFVTGGAQLIATFAPDSGHDLEDATAGAVTIDVLFAVLA